MKRLLDILLAGIALLALAPVMLLLAVLVRLDSPGPALYRQVRIGRGAQPFTMLKFRSMVTAADRIGGYATAADDSRITRLGRFIRRGSLDELPQLINVLKGDMSLVGPRPDVPAQRELYTEDEWRMRHSVRPGLTGLAQATLRSEATVEQRKALDLAYVGHRSFWGDIGILLLTFRRITGKGAN